jgi:Ca2+/H+ antiporter
LFVFSVALLVVNSFYIVASVESSDDVLPTDFVALIVIPIALSGVDSMLTIAEADTELLTCVIEAMTWSTMRTLFFVGPVAVILAWISDAGMSMTPDGFQVVALGLAIALLFSVLHYSPATVLDIERPYDRPEGLLLITSFLLFATASCLYDKKE